jgi:hypothetical protein
VRCSKANAGGETRKALEPRPRSLLEPVERLGEAANVVAPGVVDKAGGLIAVYLLLQYVVSKGVLRIEFVHRLDTRARQGEHGEDRVQLDHREEGVTEINAHALCSEPTDYPPCFVLLHRSISLHFMPQNPLSSNHISSGSLRNESLGGILHERIVLLLHCRTQIGIAKCGANGGGKYTMHHRTPIGIRA